MIDKVCNRIIEERHINNDIVNIAILGMSYKPDVNDTRESPSIKLVSLLENAKFHVKIYDPNIDGTMRKDILEAADLAVIMVAHKEFKKLSPIYFNHMRHKILYDACNCLNRDKFPDFKIIGLGVPS